MTREEAKNYITEHAIEYFTRDKSRKGYICPICGSGNGRKGTGITENPKSKGHFTCWAGCFSNADIFEIIGKVHNLTDFNEIFSMKYLTGLVMSSGYLLITRKWTKKQLTITAIISKSFT